MIWVSNEFIYVSNNERMAALNICKIVHNVTLSFFFHMECILNFLYLKCYRTIFLRHIYPFDETQSYKTLFLYTLSRVLFRHLPLLTFKRSLWDVYSSDVEIFLLAHKIWSWDVVVLHLRACFLILSIHVSVIYFLVSLIWVLKFTFFAH